MKTRISLTKKQLNKLIGREWFKNKNLHLATTLNINEIPNIFAFLDDYEIPYTTNYFKVILFINMKN